MRWGWLRAWLRSYVLEQLRSELGAIVSPTFGEMRGKVGGVVWSRNKGGPYLRLRSTPTNPNSPRQQSTRNWLTACAVAWNNTLTEPQRALWREFAETHSWTNSLGISIFLTGLDWFSMVNSRRLDAGDVIASSPDGLLAPNPFTTINLAFTSTTTVTLTFTPALPVGGYVQMWGSGPLNVGQDPNFRQMRLVGYSAANAASPVTMTLPWAVVSGKKLKIYAAVMSSQGVVSSYLSDEATQA